MKLGGNLSLTQDRLKSNFDSVQQQTGLFAGKGGYQVEVGNHTQLDGAVISSTASNDKNSLTTGTLGWTNLRNEADFTAQHQGINLSSAGPVGSQFTGNMASSLLVGANHSGHDSSTTYAAVSPGALLLTKPSNQTQDVATLDRDPANATNALSPIFNKEKEQQRLRQAQMIAEIGNQAMDVIRTNGAIEAAKAQKDPVALAAARTALLKAGNTNPSADDIAKQVTETAMRQYGTGSSLQRAAQAVTAAVQGLAGGNLQAAISGAAAPYLANTIKQMAGDNDQARIMAQAVLGAVVAKAQGNSAAAGATGAAVGELIAASIYPNTNHQDLTESERQIVSMLSTLAAGLAGGLASGDAAGGIAGAQAGQNAVENNNLSQTESIEFNQKKAEYAKGCAGAAAASPGCQTLKKELAALEDKGRSIFQQEYLAVGSDMGTDTVTKNEPGSVVPCVGSSNGYCVISNTKVQTREGMEWALSPASDVQAQAQLAQNQQDSIQLDQRVREKGQEWFEGGCGGVGPGSTLCQAYFAAGGQNPFTGRVASTSERIGNAAALALGLLPFLPLGLGGASKIVRNPNLTSALTDAEAGILVERGSLGGAKGTGGAKPTVELFGGKNAQTPGAINVDIRADIQSGIRADATKLPFNDGSLGEVIATNPYMGPGGKMMDFLPEATRVVEPGGKIYINANGANRYGKLPSQAELDSLGLRVVQDNGTLDSRFTGQTFFQSDGVSPVKNISTMRTIVLERIK